MSRVVANQKGVFLEVSRSHRGVKELTAPPNIHPFLETVVYSHRVISHLTVRAPLSRNPLRLTTAVRESQFRLGQKIEGRYHGRGQWYNGRIVGVNSDGTYDVRYDDGDEDLGLDASALKAVDAGGASRESGTDNQRKRGEERSPGIGDRVEARVPDSARWRTATIVGDNRDGTLDVQFRDGTEEKHLEPSLVRVPQEEQDNLGRGQEASGAESFRVGDDIEARYRGKSKWFKGVIRRINSDNTYDIRYADGDRETGVNLSLVRLLHAPGGSSGTSGPIRESYRTGDKVEARFGGGARWFPATVERENRDGTFNLFYDNGDVERAVDKSLMRTKTIATGARYANKSPGRRVVSGASADAGTDFHQGDKVEARYKRGRKWFSGTIRAVNRDGTYDIRYDDDDTEERVDPGLVRAFGVGSSDSMASAMGKKHGEGEFYEGDAVEARFGGRSRWFKATVRRKNRDGTYHLMYADGDEERAVEKYMIRAVERPERREDPKPASQGSPSCRADRELDLVGSRRLRIGDDIEARYKGETKWSPGVIRSVNRDGTYDIRYKDGNQERDVDSSLVREKGSSSIESLGSSLGGFSRGDKVEARFRGRSRWFKAKVERDNSDGTFHLVYEDGDEERRVSKGLMRRLLEGGPQEETKGSKTRSSDRRPTGDIESNSESTKYHVGDEIEARYKRGRKWYPGVVRAVNRDGTFDIRYTDGDIENCVEAEMIRGKGRDSLESLAPSAIEGEQTEFVQGEKVEARAGGRSRWCKATVERRNRNGTYDIVYLDGDEERAVDKNLIRRLGNGRDPDRPITGSGSTRPIFSGGGSDVDAPVRKAIVVGDEVESRYKRGRKWYPGVVRAANRDGTYDIRYKDGDVEYDVDASFVRVVSVESLASNADVKNPDTEYTQGDEVEARFRGRSRWFEAKVARVNRDGTYHLVYTDGDEERSVPKDLMRKLESDTARGSKVERQASAATDTANELKKYRVGEEIEARYKQGRKWYAGVIQAVSKDGAYDIRYSDGDSERDVDPSFVRGKVGASITSLDSAAEDFGPGDKVEARSGGRSRWCKATVERKNRNGTYHLQYVDGDEETAVEKDLIRKPTFLVESRNKSPGRRVVSEAPSDPDFSALKGYRAEDEVEARYKRGQKWYPGVIRSVNRDGTYNIRYKDGDSEQDVAVEMIRSASLARVSLPSTSSDGALAGSTKNFAMGDKVEARFGGRSRWFKATIQRTNRDGTYNLIYEDGDKERSVEKELIRRIDYGGGGRSGSRSPGRRTKSVSVTDRVHGSADEELREGDAIEARYRQGHKWFSGVIRSVNRDGTYHVLYDDGDKERSVERALIRHKSAGSFDPPTSSVDAKCLTTFNIDDEVEARFGGRSRWVRATVESKNRDGTYHLIYANGEEERRVESELIRKLNRGGDPSTDNGYSTREKSRHARERAVSVDSLASNSAGFHVGDKVEARFRGGSRWFKAAVERENLDGTFNLLYDDGDKERAVRACLIRSLEPRSDEAKTAAGYSSEHDFCVGDKIEARYKRGRRWYQGVVRVVNLDGTLDIRYNDGDSESGVPAEFVRKVVNSSNTSITLSETGSFATGDKVEARYGGRSRWLRATVERKSRDGTYQLLYENGDQEKGVERDLIRKINAGNRPGTRGVSRTTSSGGAGSETDVEQGDMKPRDRNSKNISKRVKILPRVGDKIEARFRGDRNWLPGNVSRVHRDGSYDIIDADGNSEIDVPADHVRPLATGERSTDSDGKSNQERTDSDVKDPKRAFKEGDHVDARLHGRTTWQKATITRVHSNGTYNVRSRDGEQQKRLSPRFVRQLRGAPSCEYVSPSRRRSGGGGVSNTEESHSEERGRSRDKKTTPQRAASKEMRAIATRVRRALRKTGRTVEDFKQKLERLNRANGGQGIDRKALETVLADIGVNITHREAHDMQRCCGDVDNVDCIKLSSLISFVHCNREDKRPTSLEKRRSSNPRDRRSRSLSSTSESSIGAQRRPRGVSRSRSRGVSSSASETDLERRRFSPRKKRGGKWTDDTSSVRQRLLTPRRGKNAVAGTDTASESDESGSTSPQGQKYQVDSALLSKRGFDALKRLEGPAFDGSLRREFEKQSGGREQPLPTSRLKR